MGWFYKNSKWVNLKGKEMNTKEDFVDWWSGWYKQETKLVMPEIVKKKMLEQLAFLENLPIHRVSKCLKCEPMEYDIKGIRYFKCKYCGKEMK